MQLDRSSVQIVVGGRAHAGWTGYDIDSDLMTPADAWSVMLRQTELQVPPGIEPGAPVQVRLAGETVLVGQVDDLTHAVDKGGHRLVITGRDAAAVLLDCSAPIWSAEQLTLDQVVARIVRPLGITRVRIDAASTLLRDRVSIEPGDSGWDALRRAAEANGLWPWFAPDGTLVVGGPDYSAAPVDRLALRRDGLGNIVSLSDRRSVADRYSEVTVLGQAHAVGDRRGRHNVRAVVRDAGLQVHRPRIVVDHEATNEAIARARARKLISDGRVRGFELLATVAGHRTSGGTLWQPGQRVELASDPHGIVGVFFLVGRRFGLHRDSGQLTHLRLIEDGAWVLDAHPSKRKHRRGKNAPPALQLLDGSKGAPPP